MKKALVAVSGGPDSIYLLNKLVIRKKCAPIAMHVNYHLRGDESNSDQELVEIFCKKNNIKLYILDVNKKILTKYNYLKNLQAKYRAIRYDFFKEITLNEKTNDVYVGHHKDDFIETAIMQEDKSDNYFYYGLQKKSFLNGMIIHRPLLNLYKDEIIKSLILNDISYAIDSTNEKEYYTRNQLRLKLLTLNKTEKHKLFKHYDKLNKSNELRNIKINRFYKRWAEANYAYDVFKNFDDSFKKFILFKFLIENENYIKINNNKLEGVLEYLDKKSPEKEYRLMVGVYLTIIDNSISIINK